MIILTFGQAAAVAGIDSPLSALAPRPLADGTYGLPEEVLTDVNHAAHWAALAGFPTRHVADNEWAT